MTRFTLIAEHTDLYGKPNGHKVTHEFTVDDLHSVLENTDLFIRGIGYMPTGTLDYVTDEEYYGFSSDGHDGMGSTLEDYPEIKDKVQHSQYYFDTERNK
jgi:hypothetical protein